MKPQTLDPYMLPPGEPAPDFTMPAHDGTSVTLSDFRGRWVLLWWYPKALTPGCTSCGQGFQARISDFYARDVVILGVSFDLPERNADFARRHHFAYPLLTANFAIGREWGTKRGDDEEWADVPRRLSYLIDPAGRIVRVYKVLDPSQHPAEVLRDLDELRQLPDPVPTSRVPIRDRVRRAVRAHP